MNKFFLSLLSLLAYGTLLAQDSSATQKIQFKLGINYNSNLHFYGRTDSLRSSGFFPMAELWLGQHFYLNAAPIFVHNKSFGADYAGSLPRPVF